MTSDYAHLTSQMNILLVFSSCFAEKYGFCSSGDDNPECFQLTVYRWSELYMPWDGDFPVGWHAVVSPVLVLSCVSIRRDNSRCEAGAPAALILTQERNNTGATSVHQPTGKSQLPIFLHHTILHAAIGMVKLYESEVIYSTVLRLSVCLHHPFFHLDPFLSLLMVY